MGARTRTVNALAPIGGKSQQGGYSTSQRIELGEKVLDMRNRGMKVGDAAAALGLHWRTAYRYMDLALASRVAPTVDKFRAMENERLDDIERQVDDQVKVAELMVQRIMDGEARGDLMAAMTLRDKAIGRRIELSNRRARLNGLDAPIKIDHTVEQLDPREAELAQMVREAKAKMGAETDG